MIRSALICSLMAMAAVVPASAEDFPLTFRTIPATEVMSFPGGYGTYGQLRLAKPAGLNKEPKAVSRRPLYGECRDKPGEPGFVFRLDESKGDGKGYDQLIVDMNQNGDLTDEVAVQPVSKPGDRTVSSSAMQEKLFGPIAAPASTVIAGGRPVYYAQVYVVNVRNLRSAQNVQNLYAGQLRLRAGWYAETTVELKGVKQKVGVYDGDSNVRLGDVAKPQTYRSGGEPESWTFGSGDFLLVDKHGTGKFERDVSDSEASPFGPVLYLGASPYKVALTPGGKSLQVEPWPEALAQVSLQPLGDQVRNVTLAWESGGGQWQLIRAAVAAGQIKVPRGNYRLYTCELLGKGPSRDQVMALGYQREIQKPLAVAAGQENVLRCGAPLELKVTADKRKPESWELNSGLLRQPPSSADSEFIMSINANVVGKGGEVYSTYARGERLDADPPKPSFSITDQGARKVGNGNLEFG